MAVDEFAPKGDLRTDYQEYDIHRYYPTRSMEACTKYCVDVNGANANAA